jgi:hypothetical protein
MKGNKMKEYTEVIHNVETGEITYRPYTNEEIIQAQELAKLGAQRATEIEAETEAKAQAKAALLAQLGITEEQAKLLLS